MASLSDNLIQFILTSVAAVYCLLGYWLAFGKQNWIWRATTLGVALALLVPIRAYEPLVFFVLTAFFFLVAGGCRNVLYHWIKKRDPNASATDAKDSASATPRFQFRRHDFLGMMAVIGAGIWMSRIVLLEQVLMPWAETLSSAVLAVAITLATIGLLRGPLRIVSGIVLVFAIGASAQLFQWGLQKPLRGENIVYILLGTRLYWSIARLQFGQLSALLAFVFFLVFCFAAQRVIQPREAKPLQRRLWQTLGFVPCSAWLLAIGWVYCHMLTFPHPLAQNLNRPNSLITILDRGSRLYSLSGTEAQALSTEIINLSKESGFVTIPWDVDLFGRRNYDNEWVAFYSLAAYQTSHGLDSRATLLEAMDPDRAAEHLMAILRIANMMQREGLREHGDNGDENSENGVNHLASLRRRLSAKKGREIVAEFEAMERSRDKDQIARDHLWHNLNERWAFGLYQVIDSENEPSVLWGRSICTVRLLMIDLALRAYRVEHEGYPLKLEELTPQYLAEIPLDPFCGKSFIYRPDTEDFVLYSVGLDGYDNGGNCARPSVGGRWDHYDLCLDVPQGHVHRYRPR
jgi:hypothetical protein